MLSYETQSALNILEMSEGDLTTLTKGQIRWLVKAGLVRRSNHHKKAPTNYIFTSKAEKILINNKEI